MESTGPIDLRSDTVTRPTSAMRQAMASAEVGDDVFGEDPTVRRLEERAAELMGKQAALLVPSGTMGNLVAIMVLTRPGDEVLLEERGHSMRYELGGMAALAGVQARPVRSADGVLHPASLVPLIQTPGVSWSGTRLLIVENTHNMAGGTVTPIDVWEGLVELARSHDLRLHLDGARIFNAAVALNLEPARLTRGCDTVMFCLSKGLAAPVGSLVAGSREFVAEARHARKRLGGGMRQAGVLAAAGLVALETMVDRLAEDHANARRLAEGLAELPWVDLDPAGVQTNIVVFGVRPPGPEAARLVELLSARGVLAFAVDSHRVRMVVHYQVQRADIDKTLRVVQEAG